MVVTVYVSCYMPIHNCLRDFASGGSPPRPLPAGRETTDDEDDVPAVGSVTRFLEAPLSSVRLMYSYGPRMRTLAALLLLQSIPMYM